MQMAFWQRITQSKVKLLSRQFKKCCAQNASYASSLSYLPKISSSPGLQEAIWGFCKRPADFCSNVRFFAAPVQFQAQAKKQEKDTSGGARLNDQINAQYVRLVTDEGHNVVSLCEALERARRLKLDLVEVQRSAVPPVCKIMDYHREKYIRELKDKDLAKSKSGVTLRKGDCKEVRFAGKTEQKDLKMKADTVIRLMERGYRVKCMAMSSPKRGSSKASLKKGSGVEGPKMDSGDEEDISERNEDVEDLGALLSRLTALIEDVSVVEYGPRVEKRQAYVIVRHVKFGPLRKGGAKKLKDGQKITTAPPTANSSAPFESPAMLNKYPAESGGESESQVLSEEDDPPDKTLKDDKPAWSVADSTDDFNILFNFSDDAKEPVIKPIEEIKAVPETASSSLNSCIPNYSHPRPAHDSTRADGLKSSPLEPSLVTEKRYKRIEPRNQFPPTSTDNRSPYKRDAFRFEPQFSNQRMQPPWLEINMTNTMAGEKQVATDSSAFRKLEAPHEMPNREASTPEALSTPTSSYGILCSPRASPSGKQSFATEVDKNNEGKPRESARSSNTRDFGQNSSLPSSKTDGGQRAGIDKGGQGRWGIFSRDGRNVNPNTKSKSD